MKLNQMLAITGIAALTCVCASSVLAQDNQSGRDRRGGRGNFDPAQMQQERMNRLKEQLEINEDAEWKAIEPLIQKVNDSQRAVFSDRIRGMFGRGPRPGGDNPPGGSDQGGPRRGFGGEPSPEAEALQKAIDAKASNSELKAALAKFQDARKAHQAALEKAQTDLRKVLTTRQEAIASLNGLL